MAVLAHSRPSIMIQDSLETAMLRLVGPGVNGEFCPRGDHHWCEKPDRAIVKADHGPGDAGTKWLWGGIVCPPPERMVALFQNLTDLKRRLDIRVIEHIGR